MLLSSLISIILSSASILKRDFSILLSRIALSNLLLVFCISYNSVYFTYMEKGLTLYNGLYQTNSNSHIFNIFLIILTYFILSITSYYPRKIYLNNTMNSFTERSLITASTNKNEQTGLAYEDLSIDDNTLKDTNTESIKDINVKQDTTLYIIDKNNNQFKILEYSLLILFVLCGAIFLISINDTISIFISIELQSYGLYLLSSVYRNSELSTKAGLTYFLLGGLSSCFILLSQGLIYINSGNTNLENIYVLYNINMLTDTISPQGAITSYVNNSDYFYSQFYINMSLIILSVGFLFKISAAPFHFWSPDVYDGVPTIVTTFIAIVAKVSILIFLLQLINFTNNTYIESMSYNWNKNLLVSSLLSLIIGTVLGLTQSRIKRLYAYSTISHLGFILLSLSINSTESIQAFIFYLIQYSISNLNAFVILLSIGYFLINFGTPKEQPNLTESSNSPLQFISQVKGLYKLNAMLALSFALALFSFLGVPPLLGFFAKQMVLSAALDNGYVFMSLIAILTSVISAVYYLLVIKQVFFEDSDYKNYTEINMNDRFTNMTQANTVYNKDIKITNYTQASTMHNHIKLSSNLTFMISVLTLISLVFMFVASESLNLVRILSLFIFNV